MSMLTHIEKKSIILNLLNEKVLSEYPTCLAQKIGHAKNYFIGFENKKRLGAIDNTWNLIKKHFNVSEKFLVLLNEIVEKHKEFTRVIHIPTSDNDYNYFQWRMELLRTYVNGDFNGRRHIIKTKGLKDEILFLNGLDRDILIGLHAYYSYQYLMASKEELPGIIDFLSREIAKCYPMFFTLVDNYKFADKCFNIVIDNFCEYLKAERRRLYTIDVLSKADNMVEDSFSFNIEDFIRVVELEEDSDIVDAVKKLFCDYIYIKDMLPIDQIWGNCTVPQVICEFMTNSYMCFLITIMMEENECKMNAYLIHKHKDSELMGFTSLHNGDTYLYRPIYDSQNTLDRLEPVQPIPGLDFDLVSLEDLNEDDLSPITVSLVDILANYLELLGNLTIVEDKLIVDRAGLTLNVYNRSDNKTYTYRLKKEDFKEPELFTLVDGDVTELTLYNECRFYWPRIKFSMPLSAFECLDGQP